MPKFGKVAILPMLMSAVVAATAGAQGAAGQCDIDENTTISMAVFSLLTAQQQGIAQAEQTKQLQKAVAQMFPGDQKKSDADNAKNPVGRAYTLGRIYMIYLSQPDMPVVTTRGALGFKTDATAPADLAAGIDSAFSVVEEKAPACAALASQWRQQGGWVKLVQAAMDYANSGKVDSADAMAQKALKISPTAPYSHLVLGNVAAQRRQYMEAIKFYKDALAEADKDTVFAEVRRTILYTLGNFAGDAGQDDTIPANKKIYFAEALAAFDALGKDPGTKFQEAATQGRTLVLRASGDTAAIRTACQGQVQNPADFSFASLVQCGVTLADIGDIPNATRLFEAAHAKNPNHRDGLFNLALMQIGNAEYQKAIGTTDRLLVVDPSNPENVRLYYHSWIAIRKSLQAQIDTMGKKINALGRTAADQAKRKTMIDSVTKLDAASKDALNKAVTFNTQADEMPVKVVFSEFSAGAEKTTIGGTIQNRTDAEKSYVLSVEFLDKDGQVVTTGKATVDKVAPMTSGQFTLVGMGAGIVAFRYTPL